MLSKQEKKNIIRELTEALKSAKSVVFSNFQGLATKDSQVLRSSLRKEGTLYQVVKITLLKRALKNAGIDSSKLDLGVPVSVSISAEDEVTPARILNSFAKSNENLKILGGVLEREFIGLEKVKVLASLPGKQELRQQLVSVVASPLRGFVSVLAGNLIGLVNVLNAIKEAKA